MGWTSIIVGICLIAVNLYYIRRSHRKRKFGIFPGKISFFVIGSFLAYCIFTFYPSSALSSQEEYNNVIAMSDGTSEYTGIPYEKAKADADMRINTLIPGVHFLLNAVVIQLGIGVSAAFFGLLTIPKRRSFYYLCLTLYAAGFIIVAVSNRLL